MATVASVIVPLGVSALALIFSVFTFFYSRHLNKRDLLLKMHQEMTSIESQRGRGVLIKLTRENRSVQELVFGSADRDSANHALSQIDILGYYCKKRYIKESDILDLWHSSLRAIGPKAQEFIKVLDDEKDTPVWPYGRHLLAKAQTHNLSH